MDTFIQVLLLKKAYQWKLYGKLLNQCKNQQKRQMFKLLRAIQISEIVLELIHSGIRIHCLRDLTRGGLASSLNEIAQDSNVTIQIDENFIPVREDVQGACEILGLDPLYVANEGRFVAFVSPLDAKRALAIMKSHKLGNSAQIIGSVTKNSSPTVIMKSKIGANRIVDMLSGEQLSRIC
jgi:hydrogenase expression/formation protein HypE